MNRVFLSLYIVIVVSVIGLGWGADKLWQAYNPEPESQPSEQLFFSYLEQEGFWQEAFDPHAKETELSEKIKGKIVIYTLEDFAKSAMISQLEEGRLVQIYNDVGQRLSYKRIANTPHVLHLVTDHVARRNNTGYVALLIAFYCAIAVVVYFWVWPLSRDLRRLQNYTQKVGVNAPAPEKITLNQRSAVYDLAVAFNRMAERITELLASHKEMTYAVSHELRTPLARMKFALEMLPGSSEKESIAKHVESLRADVSEMDKLINELLAYAGFEQKQQALEMEAGDLVSLVTNVCETNIVAAADKKLMYTINDHLHGEPVYCEWYLMERALHNLIQNAVRYAKSTVSITLSLNDNSYLVEIEDDGPGIPEGDRSKVFEAFVRLRQSKADNKSGFGLGLAIVRRIVRWHGGCVHVDASPIGGAAFKLRWPKNGGGL